MKKIFLFFCLFPLLSQAQDFGLSSIKTGIVKPDYLTKIHGAGGTDTNFKPTPETNLGLAVTMGPVIVFFMVSAVSTSDKVVYGDTQTSDLLLRLHGENHNFDLDYKNTKGFYIENSTEVNPAWTSDNKIQRSDVKENRLRFTYLYTFSPEKFKLGIFDQTFVPSGSGGSFFLGGQFSKYTLDAPTAFAPATQTASYGKIGTLQEADLLSLKPAVGGGYVFDFSGIYVAGSAMYLAGPQMQRLDFGTTTENKNIFPVTELQLKASVGYNEQHFFTAANFEMNQESQEIANGSLTHSDQSLSAWVGWRF